MNTLFYTILFVVGVVIGCYLAVKADEIPRRLDLKRTHYSNHSNEKLISKLTYIFMGGLCSVILANVLNINIHEIDPAKLIIYIFAMTYISTLIITAGVDRNYTRIDKKLLAFGIIASILYMLYLCVVDLASLHLSAIYFAIYIVLLIIDSFLLRKFAKDSYIIDNLILMTIILVFTDLRTLTYTITMAIIAVGIYTLLIKTQERKNGNKKLKISTIPVGYFISAGNIMVLFMIRIFENYFI